MFVAAGHELEEEVRCVLLEGQVADFVDDDQPVAAQPGELVGEPAGAVGVGEPGDPVGRGPAGLVTRAETGAGVAVDVLVERVEVQPEGSSAMTSSPWQPGARSPGRARRSLPVAGRGRARPKPGWFSAPNRWAARRAGHRRSCDRLSATLENEADATLENEATGSCCLVCRVLGSHAGQGVDSAVA